MTIEAERKVTNEVQRLRDEYNSAEAVYNRLMAIPTPYDWIARRAFMDHLWAAARRMMASCEAYAKLTKGRGDDDEGTSGTPQAPG